MINSAKNPITLNVRQVCYYDFNDGYLSTPSQLVTQGYQVQV